MFWLFLLPVLLIGIAAVLAFVFTRRSSLRITAAGVEVRNYPQPPTTVPLDEIDRFVPTERVGWISAVQPATAALLLTNGSRVRVRSIHDESGASGVDALNARLAQVRGAR